MTHFDEALFGINQTKLLKRNSSQMNISIVGTGYVGLVSGVCLAEKGHKITCVDLDHEKVNAINNGESPIYEKDLESLLQKHVGKNLNASINLEEAIHQTSLTMICVGTPFKGDAIDLSYVRNCASEIGKILSRKSHYHTIIVKSTVVPGTTEECVLPALEENSGKSAGKEFGVGMNPEFLKEGNAIQDFMNPDRIILGGIDDKTRNELEQVYESFDHIPKLATNCRTAEMIKYASNSLLATMISFANELGNLCSQTPEVDIKEVMRGVHLDERLSPKDDQGKKIRPGFLNYLEAGCGFGGSCFPKDVKALVSHGKKSGENMRILSAVLETNALQPKRVIQLLQKFFPNLQGKKIAVLGLAFKPETDDIRESPAIPVISDLLKEDAHIFAFDPAAEKSMENCFSREQITYEATLNDAIKGKDAAIIMTRWKEFEIIPELIHQMNKNLILIDGRRLIDEESVPNYDGIGIGPKVD